MTRDPTRCATCNREIQPDERRREPGWERDDYDCPECFAQWPMVAAERLRAKKEVAHNA